MDDVEMAEMSATGEPDDLLRDELEADAMSEVEAYWASPEGQERQRAEFAAYVAEGNWLGGE